MLKLDQGVYLFVHENAQVSEPGGGSDVASLTTSAKRVGGDLVINGTKMWITSGLQARWNRTRSVL